MTGILYMQSWAGTWQIWPDASFPDSSLRWHCNESFFRIPTPDWTEEY